MDKEYHKLLLKKAVVEFEKTAEILIHLLADSFQLDLEEFHPFGKLISRKNNLSKGDLEDNWHYHFHGDACKFENHKTGQIVDVKINRNGNWGTISNFYLFRFIETTDSLICVYEVINTEKIVSELLDEMLKDEILIDVGEPYSRTLILRKT